MRPKLVTKTMHAYLDYPVALSLMTMPLLLGLGDSHAAARYLATATGVAALILTVLTDHRTGVIRVLPYPVHLAVDFAVGIAFIIVPLALGFSGADLAYYLMNAAAVLTVVSLHKPDEEFQAVMT